VLDVLAPDDEEARLACQVRPEGDLEIRVVPEPGKG
jgi:ferredoxin